MRLSLRSKNKFDSKLNERKFATKKVTEAKGNLIYHIIVEKFIKLRGEAGSCRIEARILVAKQVASVDCAESTYPTETDIALQTGILQAQFTTQLTRS